MIDAWGKFPSGVLYGNFYEYGNFDECINVYKDSNQEDVGVVAGQYCVAELDLTNFTGNSGMRGVMPSPGGG